MAVRKLITAFFTQGGVPKTGLSPTIDIYMLDPLIPATNTLVVSAGALTEIGNGWYRYDFLTYEYANDYVFTIDGGTSVDSRYLTGGNDSFQEDISYQAWEEPSADHLAVGTMGYQQNQTSTDVSQIRVDTTTALGIVQLLLKHTENRTKIDPLAFTLTVYDNNGVTPLQVFNLKDVNGNPSITSVFERDPV